MAATTTLKPARTQVIRYVGVSDWWGRHVWVERGGVRSSLPYLGDQPMPFAWGRRGIGARELSRSILHDVTGSDTLAERLCRDLTHEVVAHLPEIGFELTREDVLVWLAVRRAA